MANRKEEMKYLRKMKAGKKLLHEMAKIPWDKLTTAFKLQDQAMEAGFYFKKNENKRGIKQLILFEASTNEDIRCVTIMGD